MVNVIIAGSEHKCVMISLGLGLKNATATMETVKKISDCGRGRGTGGRIKRQRRIFLGQ